MRHFQKVYYLGCEWIFIAEVNDKYLLRSTNKNIDDVLANPQSVKPLEENRS